MPFPSQKSGGGGSSSCVPAACPGPCISGAGVSRRQSLSSARGRARQHPPSFQERSVCLASPPKGLRRWRDRHGGTQRAKCEPPPPPLTSSAGRSFFWAAFLRFFCFPGEKLLRQPERKAKPGSWSRCPGV